MAFDFEKALRRWTTQHKDLVGLKNARIRDESGVFERWDNPVLTAAHAPLFWRYDLDRRRNPFLLERLGIACVSGAGAVERGGKICLVARLVGKDGRAFFAVAESDNGVDNFHFWDHPLRLPPGGEPGGGLSDMRLTAHEDGWLYGVFGAGDGHGIVRTRDLVAWERLADLRADPERHGSVSLHPELVRGQYAFYARAGVAFCENVEAAELGEPRALEPRPAGVPAAPPLRTPKGWLHIALATTVSGGGPRAALTAFLCDIEDPTRVAAAPAGYLLAADAPGEPPAGALACAGVVARGAELFVYYAAGGRLHVATSSVERMLDHASQAKAEAEGAAAVRQALVERNLKLLARTKGKAYRGLRS